MKKVLQKRLLEQVLKTVRNYDMLKSGDKVLAAVSGGPDSVFLLLALYNLKNKIRLKGVSVCNLDHSLRGAESKKDSLFVKTLAAELGLEFVHKKVDLNKRRAKGLSTEETAREARYEFFSEAAEKTGSNVVATGHTLDDQVETILMRLIKGASLKGIIGIAPVREAEALHIIRPLIEIGKAEIVQFLNAEGISYRIDSTNAESIYFRNIVRKEIVPFLEKYNPRLKRALFNLAENLREDFRFIEEAKGKAHPPSSLGADSHGVEIELKKIIIQPKAIQKEILRDMLETAGGEVKRLSFRHWKELENLISRKSKGSSVDLPGGIRAVRNECSLVFASI